MGEAADRWRAAAEDPSRLVAMIQRWKFVSSRRAERIKAERSSHQKELEALRSDLQHVTNELANSLRREQDAWTENNKLKAELAARDSKPVDNADSIRARLLQPFLGSEAEKLGATKYQLLGGERWLKTYGIAWVTCKNPAWFDDSKYRLATGEQHADATD